jgi:hypothetical protein
MKDTWVNPFLIGAALSAVAMVWVCETRDGKVEKVVQQHIEVIDSVNSINEDVTILGERLAKCLNQSRS